jgi:hypothetical protein
VSGREEELGNAELDAELAIGGRGRDRDFPAAWGAPLGHPLSEQRIQWVTSHVHQAIITQRFTYLEQAQGRLLVIARGAYLDSVKQCP